MHVHALAEGTDHVLVSRNVRQKAKLDLGIVGVDDDVVLLLGQEEAAQLASELSANGNVLQVGLGGGKTPRGRSRLLEGGMHASMLICHLEQSVGVGALELGELTVVQDLLNDGVVGTKLVQDLGVGRISRLGLLGVRKLEGVKKHLAKLLWRIDVKRLPCMEEDLCLERLGYFAKLLTVGTNALAVNVKANRLHIRQHAREGHLQIEKKAFLLALAKLCADLGIQTQEIGDGRTALVKDLAKVVRDQAVKRVDARGIDQIGRQHQIVQRKRTQPRRVGCAVKPLSVVANHARDRLQGLGQRAAYLLG